MQKEMYLVVPMVLKMVEALDYLMVVRMVEY